MTESSISRKRSRFSTALPVIAKKARNLPLLSQIETVNDLIRLGLYYHPGDPQYDTDIYKNLFKVIPPLLELNRLVGLQKIKKKIIDQIIYFIQELHIHDAKGGSHFLNTVITGAPGTGKTTLATILGQIYFHLGFLSSSKITYGKRTDFLAGYLGQTAEKTLKFLKNATPGILIIDEIYSMGNQENRDSFAKEAIDTINQYLSENKNDLITIVMGYKEDIETCFFNYNRGLKRRFPFTYEIDDYSSEDLQNIFYSMIRKNNWNLQKETESQILDFFKQYGSQFTSNGGDVENLLFYCKNAHSLNLFMEKVLKEKVNNRSKFFLTNSDISLGFQNFICQVLEKKTPPIPDSVKIMFS